MMKPHFGKKTGRTAAPPDGASAPDPEPPGPVPIEAPVGPLFDDPFDTDPEAVQLPSRPSTTKRKLADGLRGIKRALRMNSSYFAHGYRGLLIAITAVILGLSPVAWCFLLVSAALVLLAETMGTAINAVASRNGAASEEELTIAAELAAAGVLIASLTSAAITLCVLLTRLGVLLNW